MGILGKLKGSKGADTVTDADVAYLEQLFKDKKGGPALQFGKSLLERPLTTVQRDRVERTVGLTLFYSREFKEALRYLDPLARKSDNPGAYFNLASCFIMTGNIKEGLDAYNKALALFPEHGDQTMPPPSFMSLFIMQALIEKQAFQQAFEVLHRLFTLYGKLSNTDPKFLAQRGVPSLFDTLNAAMLLLCHPVAAQALKDLQPNLDEEGQAAVESLVAHLKGLSKWPLADGAQAEPMQ